MSFTVSAKTLKPLKCGPSSLKPRTSAKIPSRVQAAPVALVALYHFHHCIFNFDIKSTTAIPNSIRRPTTEFSSSNPTDFATV